MRRTAYSPCSTTTPSSYRCGHGRASCEEAGAAEADVLHLHHLTPIHEAASRVAPHVPVIGHLHGTELLMLEEIADGPPPGLGACTTRGPSGCACGRIAASA